MCVALSARLYIATTLCERKNLHRRLYRQIHTRPSAGISREPPKEKYRYSRDPAYTSARLYSSPLRLSRTRYGCRFFQPLYIYTRSSFVRSILGSLFFFVVVNGAARGTQGKGCGRIERGVNFPAVFPTVVFSNNGAATKNRLERAAHSAQRGLLSSRSAFDVCTRLHAGNVVAADAARLLPVGFARITPTGVFLAISA